MPRSHDQEGGRDCGAGLGGDVSHSARIQLTSVSASSVAARYINSVSDLYASDEIEVLLEEIRELTPGSFHTESFQDFEIDGSQTGMNTVVVEEEAEAENKCQSLMSIHSWDSHAVYHHHQQAEEAHNDDGDPLFTGVILYCDNTHLKSCTGVLRVILVISSVACLACLCTSGTAKTTLFMLPLIGRLRFMIFVTVFTLLLTCLLLFLDISHLVYIFPVNWTRLNAVLYVIVSVMYLTSASVVMSTVQFYNDSYHWIPKWTREQLAISGALGYLCAAEAVLLPLVSQFFDLDPRRTPLRSRGHSRVGKGGAGGGGGMEEGADHLSLVERKRSQTTPTANTTANTILALHDAAHFQVPSTSTMWPIDDVQPCSSKHQPHNTYHHHHPHLDDDGA